MVTETIVTNIFFSILFKPDIQIYFINVLILKNGLKCRALK